MEKGAASHRKYLKLRNWSIITDLVAFKRFIENENDQKRGQNEIVLTTIFHDF